MTPPTTQFTRARLRTPTRIDDLSVGDTHAFNDDGQLIPVTIRALIAGDEPQVVIDLPGDLGTSFVHPSRLLTPWAETSAYEEASARWTALIGGPVSRAATSAVHFVFDAIPEFTGAAHDWSFGGSVTTIRDVDLVAHVTGLPAKVLTAAPERIWEDGVLYVPWTTTALIAGELATRNIHAVTWELQASEQRLAESLAARDATSDHVRDAHAVLRRWVGQAETPNAVDVEALRTSLRRADSLLRTSLAALTTDMQEWELLDLIELLRERAGR